MSLRGGQNSIFTSGMQPTTGDEKQERNGNKEDYLIDQNKVLLQFCITTAVRADYIKMKQDQSISMLKQFETTDNKN